jgi:hypothetical protein
MAGLGVAMGVGDLLEPVAPVDHRFQLARLDQALEQSQITGVAPGDPCNDAARTRHPGPQTGERRREHRRGVDAARLQGFQGSSEVSLADRVEHEVVDAAGAGEVFAGVVDDLVGAERSDQRQVAGAADRRDPRAESLASWTANTPTLPEAP